MNNNKIVIVLLGIVTVLLIWIGEAMLSHDFGSRVAKKDKPAEFSANKVERTNVNVAEKFYGEPVQVSDSGFINLKINPLEDYNFMSKKDIYRIRKSYVKTSLFADDNYEPSEDVFGQIEDGKYWWGINQITCRRGSDNASGLSAMSRFINNPNMLIATFDPFGYDYTAETAAYCNTDFSKFIPYEMLYDRKNKLIIAKYKLGQFVLESTHNMILIGMNAKDFGYDYVYINGLTNIKMKHENSANSKIYRLRDFLHTGGSCQMEGGCNNVSPRQTELEYYILELPAEMNIKLWQNKPFSHVVPGDINYKIIFEKI